jgi:hypothetical protein
VSITSTVAVPRTSSTLHGCSFVSIVSATFGLRASAGIFGAFAGLPRTISRPSQWKAIGTTRGVPSVQVYASRAGMVERSRRWATGSFSSATSPCLVGIVPSSSGLFARV